jgi:hypothetical protein
MRVDDGGADAVFAKAGWTDALPAHLVDEFGFHRETFLLDFSDGDPRQPTSSLVIAKTQVDIQGQAFFALSADQGDAVEVIPQGRRQGPHFVRAVAADKVFIVDAQPVVYLVPAYPLLDGAVFAVPALDLQEGQPGLEVLPEAYFVATTAAIVVV